MLALVEYTEVGNTVCDGMLALVEYTEAGNTGMNVGTGSIHRSRECTMESWHWWNTAENTQWNVDTGGIWVC